MFSKATAVYKRLLVLALLSMCLVVFSTSVATEVVHADACFTDCVTYETTCYTGCANNACNTSRQDCDACMTQCAADANYCYRHSVSCNNGMEGLSCNSPGYCCAGFHNCPQGDCLIDASTSGSVSGYDATCTNYIGSGPNGGTYTCTNCPPGTSCPGSTPCNLNCQVVFLNGQWYVACP